MRESKFRGRRLDNKDWVYGYLVCMSYRAWIKDISDQYTNPRRLDGINHTADIRCVEVDPETVGEYTGLKDKNGKEIYENDIIRFAIFDYNGADTQYKGVVKWVNAMYEIWHDTESEYYGPDGGFILSWVKAQDDEFEVISNIHDNPDLVEGGREK